MELQPKYVTTQFPDEFGNTRSGNTFTQTALRGEVVRNNSTDSMKHQINKNNEALQFGLSFTAKIIA